MSDREEREREADPSDRATQREQELLADALEKHKRNHSATGKKSALRCIECGVRIPAERRKAVPGVETCVDCKELQEQLVKQTRQRV